MNEHMIHVLFRILFISCIGVFPASKIVGNNLFLIWTIIMANAGFAAMFIDALDIANVWYYGPMCCVMVGIFSYYYLQQYGKKENSN